MCVVSMVMDHQCHCWKQRYWQREPILPMPGINYPLPAPLGPLPTTEEVGEFRELLERARDYDKRNNEPACESDSKKALLKRMADALGVDISFVDA